MFNLVSILFIVLLLLMLVAGVAAVMMRSLVKSALCLAACSVFLAIALFFIEAPIAAIFELSVCAGLITVITISAISMTAPYTDAEKEEITKERRSRYVMLPFILLVVGIVAGAALLFGNVDLLPIGGYATSFATFKEVLWQVRQVDILGQVIVILAGVFAVVVLFKERDEA